MQKKKTTGAAAGGTKLLHHHTPAPPLKTVRNAHFEKSKPPLRAKPPTKPPPKPPPRAKNENAAEVEYSTSKTSKNSTTQRKHRDL
jgi:hypothetical protein